MANYNLETETTTHLKGMQFGDSQGDNGGGDLSPLPLNATYLRPRRSAIVYRLGTSEYYFKDFFINEELNGEVISLNGTGSVYYRGQDGAIKCEIITKAYFVDKYFEGTEIVSAVGDEVLIVQNKLE